MLCTYVTVALETASGTLLYIFSNGKVMSCRSLINEPRSFKSRYGVDVSYALGNLKYILVNLHPYYDAVKGVTCTLMRFEEFRACNRATKSLRIIFKLT